MNKNVFIRFLKDRVSFSIAYFLVCLFLLLFFRLSAGKRIEVLYPLAITVFIYLFFMSFEFVKYYRFNVRLSNCMENNSYLLPASTCEQKEMSTVIHELLERHAREIAELKAGEEEYRRFLSQWVHGMKTPVSVIDLILQKCGTEEMPAREVLDKIGEENGRICTMLDNILNMLRLEEFSRDYVPRAMDLAASVKRVVNGRKNQFIYSHVFPVLQCSNEAVSVLSDSKWNDLMVDQLISNAVKYSKADGESRKIFIRLEQSEDKVFLIIKDQGIGIPPHDLKKVFEPFFTGENGRRHSGSTGIGLYMCRVIAEKLGHRISIESEVDCGTTVTVEYLSKM